MAEVNLDVAMESTSQEILNKVVNGVKVDFRSPVAITYGYANANSNVYGTVLTGTGRGTLHLAGSTDAKPVIIVDGVTIVNKTSVTATNTTSIEFTNSFSITIEKQSNAVLHASAVFY